MTTFAKHPSALIHLTLTFVLILFLTSCSEIIDGSQIDNSLENIEEVSLIDGADNITVTVNKGEESYFILDIQNISGQFYHLGEARLGWCIDWQTPIDSNGGVYPGVKAYSTLGVQSWSRINYILNHIGELRTLFTDASYREIQLVIWSLRGNPEFNLDEVNLEDLPPEFRENGNPLFSRDLVRDILNYVDEKHSKWSYSEGDYYAVILETPADVQTLITVVQ
ncbi:hypothetical protein [Rhodohalobacter mucosus]|uniref:Uncharacterized protein n=1 Tax=Rhodohalobacter mucosus TaxID=2079485 RepID=A0A316TWR2_9BACT|nr:hypothetical protein [Rhodohalobacter mucosus]PWN07829.1 hypothetical protein DDZ15_02120 [Rhodohalobacter mucosus]